MYTLSGQNAGLYDTLIILAGLARATERIELVVLVSPITFRHPSVLAEQSVTIDHMSGGGGGGVSLSCCQAARGSFSGVSGLIWRGW